MPPLGCGEESVADENYSTVAAMFKRQYRLRQKTAEAVAVGGKCVETGADFREFRTIVLRSEVLYHLGIFGPK